MHSREVKQEGNSDKSFAKSGGEGARERGRPEL